MASQEHLLSAAARLWSEIRGELQDGEDEGSLADSPPVPPEELKKIAKWCQQTVTKFGASAAVAEGPKDPALQPIAGEVVKAFTAAAGTLLAVRKGAGACLRAELRDVGAGLAEATDQLGAAVGTPSMAVCAGKALDRVKHLDRVSPHNKAAQRRKILESLKQLRDANRELAETLKSAAKKADGEDEDEDENDEDDLDLGDFDAEDLDPEERQVVEAVAAAASALEDLLKRASQACVPKADDAAPSVAELEVVAASSAAAANAVDGLAAHAMGGLEVKAFAGSLKELRDATSGLDIAFAREAANNLRSALDRVQAALDAVPAED